MRKQVVSPQDVLRQNRQVIQRLAVASLALALVLNVGCLNKIDSCLYGATSSEMKARQDREDRERQEERRRIAARVSVLDSSQVTGDYKILGFVECEENDPQEALTCLRIRAANLGGNAIVEVQRGTGTTRSRGAAAPLFGGSVVVGRSTSTSNALWTAKVIRRDAAGVVDWGD